MKYTKRFECILSYLRPHHQLYDLCCDHGLMGLRALCALSPSHVYFVDQSDNALKALRKDLSSLDKGLSSKSSILCIPAELCPKPSLPSDYIIAGVGIQTCISIIRALFPDGLADHRLILAPQQKSQELRNFLRDQGFGLVDETVLIERQRFREIIVIESKGETIDILGKRFRERDDEASKAFVQHLDEYYEAIGQKKSAD